MKDAKDRANKELSHLTLGRKNHFDPAKAWNINGLYKEMLTIARRFVVQAPAAKLSVDVTNWLQVANLPMVAVVGPLMATNTTATMCVTASVVTRSKRTP